MSIPIILISRDRLSTLMYLVDQLLVLGYDDIYVLDMDSTYKPLLDYYDTCKDFTLIRHQNTGHKALWTDGILKELFPNEPWVAISDSDIQLSPATPKGFIEQMILVAKDFRAEKVGLAIEYKNISNYALRNIIIPIEERYWSYPLSHSTHTCWLAPVDTTFCIVQPGREFTYNAIRVSDWPLKHLDWYSDWQNLTAEEQYYFEHADPTIATTLQHYRQWQRAQ